MLAFVALAGPPQALDPALQRAFWADVATSALLLSAGKMDRVHLPH